MCTPTNPQDAEIENRKAIYEISKAAYKECYDHTKSLDSKANIFMVVEGFALTAFSLLYKPLDKVLTKNSELAGLTLTVAILVFASILLGLGCFVSSLLLRKFTNFPYPAVSFRKYRTADLKVFYNSMIIHFNKMILKRSFQNRQKALFILAGSYSLYATLGLSAYLFIYVFTVLY